MRTRIDFSELNDYLDKMLIFEQDYNNFLKEFLVDTGEQLVEMTKSATPVDTGALKQSWGLTTSHITPHRVRLYSISKGREVKKTLFTRSGDVKVFGTKTKMYVKISNPQKYAQIIEDKYHMLASSMARVTSKMSSSYNRRFEKFKKERGL